MSSYHLIPVLIFLCLAGNTQAQVYKCISNGKVIFSDTHCSSNESGGLIQERKNPEEIYNERISALEAEQLKQQKIQLERERDPYERSRQPTVIQNKYQNLPPPEESWAERNERRNREVSKSSITKSGGKWDPKAEAERKAKEKARHREDRNSHPTNITSCDNGGCWDNRGNRYNGSGQTLFRSDGKTCNRVGTMLQCN